MPDKIKLLVVDDERDMVETLADILSMKGYDVETATSFAEAVQKAKENRFDAALIDVRLNESVGTDLLARLRAINEDMAGIMMTAFGSVYTSMKAMEYGATAYLLKPLDIDKLISTIEKGVEAKRLAVENRRMLHQLSAINSVAAAVNQSLDLEQIVSNTVKQIKTALEPDVAWIFLLDQEKNILVLNSQEGLDDVAADFIEHPVRVGEGLVGAVAQTGIPLIIPEGASRDPRAARNAWQKLQCNAFAAVPVRTKDNVLGVLGIATCGDNDRSFSPDDIELLEGMAGQVALAVENARMYAEVQRLAMIDELTGLSNRRHFFNTLEREIARALRHEQSFGLIMFDLDNFKKFNDRYGHLAGDQALQLVARAARLVVRRMDLIGRYGGEEFVILLPETDLDGTLEVAERLREAIAKLQSPVDSLPITISVGIAMYPQHATDVDGLIRMADTALYRAKGHGKDRVLVAEFDP